jgi:hypothetical protein
MSLRGAIRWLFATVLFLATTFVMYFAIGVVFVLFIGGTECDRGECPPPGEWADENPLAAVALFATLAAIPGFLMARAFLRHRR